MPIEGEMPTSQLVTALQRQTHQLVVWSVRMSLDKYIILSGNMIRVWSFVYFREACRWLERFEGVMILCVVSRH